jgi:hypothetical protein
VSYALKHLSWWLAAVALVVTSLLTWAALRWRRRTLAREA